MVKSTERHNMTLTLNSDPWDTKSFLNQVHKYKQQNSLTDIFRSDAAVIFIVGTPQQLET